jgi:tRNA (cytidine56-2'-O)-methyltransferase
MEIHVLRLGHRLPRDERITTHVALVSRAFGADAITYSGQHDGSLESSVLSIVNNWGGKFTISYSKNFVGVIKNYKKRGFTVLHLTMYGIPLPETERKIKTKRRVLVVVGAERVPKEIYELADYNIAVTSQPHSEVAALTILLDRLQKGKELERGFDRKFKGKIKVKPNETGKTVEKTA